MKFDHVGIAVESIDKSMQFYSHLGFNLSKIEEISSQKVRVGFLKLDNNANIELLEATDEESPISKFLKRKGPGVHHLCLEVKDIHKSLNQLKSKGVKLIDEQPKVGAHGCLIAFVHPSATGGVLLELSQKLGSSLNE